MKALVVGVGHYADPKLDLSYARSDAEAVAELLKDEFGFDQIWTLYDEQATKQRIIRVLEHDLLETDSNDGIVIFFAGHGITMTSPMGDDRGFLVPHDGQLQTPYSNISLTALRDDYLWMMPAKHVFLIVDTCYSGLVHRDVLPVSNEKTLDEEVLSELTRRDRKVRQVLSAGAKDQKVLDGGLFGRSVFTGRLIEAMREANPYLTADRLGLAVRDRVCRDSLDRGHRQVPQFGCLVSSDGSFVFHRQRPAVVRHGQSKAAAPKKPKTTSQIIANPNKPPKPTMSLNTAIFMDDLEQIRRHVAHGADVNEKNEEGSRTPLTIAAMYERVAAIKALIDAGADVNVKNRDGNTPLHIAARDGRTEAIKALIQANADVNAKDYIGRTPLHNAARDGHTEAIKALIQANADVNAKDEEGLTPLHSAAMFARAKAIAALTTAGADVNAKDEFGIAPLHIAAQSGYARVIKALATAGADIDSRDRYGRTPLDLATDEGHTKAVEVLRRHGAQ